MYASQKRLAVFRVVVLYIGGIIGAGFASGQEILQFFIVFGQNGYRGVVLAAVLFSYLGGVIMYLSVRMGTQSYRDLYRTVLGGVPEKIMDLLSLVMLSGGTLVMLSGGGAVFSEHLGAPHFLGTFLTALICILVIFMGTPGVISANTVLVPVKVLVIVFICLVVFILYPFPESPREVLEPMFGTRINWFWSAILYVSYNMVVPAAVLSSVGRTFSLSQGVAGGVLGGIILGLLAFMLVAAGLCFYPQITLYEVPLLFIASVLGSSAQVVFGVLIWAAILTTAIANTHGFASRFAESRSLRYKAMGTGMILVFLPLSAFKFSLLVKVMYPLFGYGGLILLAALIFVPPLKFIRRKLKHSV